MNNKIKKAKDETDVVVMCMHAGDQFNDIIGEYTKNLTKQIMANGVDVIVGNHPHDILGHEFLSDGRLITYSLGNFLYTPK